MNYPSGNLLEPSLIFKELTGNGKDIIDFKLCNYPISLLDICYVANCEFRY